MPLLEPVPATFLDEAPFRVTTDVMVDAPIERLWSLITDQASWVQWFDAMSSVEATPWHWTEVGQRRTVVVNGLRVDEVAISLVPQTEFAFSITRWRLPTAERAAEGIRLRDRSIDGSNRTVLTYIGAFTSTSIGKRIEATLERQLSAAWEAAFVALGALATREEPTHV